MVAGRRLREYMIRKFGKEKCKDIILYMVYLKKKEKLKK